MRMHERLARLDASGFFTSHYESVRCLGIRAPLLGYFLEMDWIICNRSPGIGVMECWPPARRAYGSERVMEYAKE